MWKIIEGLLFVQTKDGEKKLGVGFYILGALACIIPLVLLFNSGGSPLTKNKQTQQQGPLPIQATESALTAKTEMPNTIVAEMERELQILEEQSGSLRPEEKKKRIEEIEEKYQEKTQQGRRGSARINFTDRIEEFQREPTPVVQPTPPPDEDTSPAGYMTFAERLAAEGKSGERPSSSVINFATPEKKEPQDTELGDVVSVNGSPTQKVKGPKNLLPMGTFIPVVLEQDVISTDLQSNIWVTVATDVTFRRQLQLPLGLVRLRGRTAREPVQNLLDIHFDVMVFSDGTELHIDGNAYSAFDIRFPDRYRVRGVPGKLITPPMYTTLLNILLTAGLGGSDAYIQNYLNEQTTTDSTFTTVPVVDPTTGQVNTTLQQTQGQPVNNNIGASIGLGALQSGGEELANQIRKDLDKYRPYVKLEKGTPMFVQINTSVDVEKRIINGYALAMEEIRKNGGVPPVSRPPGDAQSAWSPPLPDPTAPQVRNMNIPIEQMAIDGVGSPLNPQTQAQAQQMRANILQQIQAERQPQNPGVGIQTP